MNRDSTLIETEEELLALYREDRKLTGNFEFIGFCFCFPPFVLTFAGMFAGIKEIYERSVCFTVAGIGVALFIIGLTVFNCWTPKNPRTGRKLRCLTIVRRNGNIIKYYVCDETKTYQRRMMASGGRRRTR